MASLPQRRSSGCTRWRSSIRDGSSGGQRPAVQWEPRHSAACRRQQLWRRQARAAPSRSNKGGIHIVYMRAPNASHEAGEVHELACTSSTVDWMLMMRTMGTTYAYGSPMLTGVSTWLMVVPPLLLLLPLAGLPCKAQATSSSPARVLGVLAALCGPRPSPCRPIVIRPSAMLDAAPLRHQQHHRTTSSNQMQHDLWAAAAAGSGAVQNLPQAATSAAGYKATNISCIRPGQRLGRSNLSTALDNCTKCARAACSAATRDAARGESVNTVASAHQHAALAATWAATLLPAPPPAWLLQAY